MPQFSVIIPLYNKEHFVKKTIESVLNQTFADFEIIVVDDGSTDKSLFEFSLIKSEKIKLINQSENQGLSAARNTGIKNATGQFITFLDADDQWKEDFLSEIMVLINQFPEAKIFATNYEEIISEKRILLPDNSSQILPERSIVEDYFGIALGQPLYCYSSICFEKYVFEKIGCFNTAITFAEDIDFNIRANLEFKLAYSKKALAQYFTFSENQITKSSISSKTILDLDRYQQIPNISLQKYLDFHRYIFAKMYKIEGNDSRYKNMIENIDWSNLNLKQKVMLFAPRIILKIVRKIKNYWLKKGIRFTTYS